jgi:exonuclease SbcD
MRLIHFSDTHLGFSESSKVDSLTGVNQREQDTYIAFNTVIQEILQHQPDLVIQAGDVFHTPRPPNRAIVAALVGFQRLVEATIPIVLIAGKMISCSSVRSF